MHDLGDGLIRARLTEPVLDVSRYTLTYPDLVSLMRDLKAIGAQNAATASPARPDRPRSDYALSRKPTKGFRSEGVLPASYEVVFGQAWGAIPREQHDGEFAFPVGAIGRRGAP